MTKLLFDTKDVEGVIDGDDETLKLGDLLGDVLGMTLLAVLEEVDGMKDGVDDTTKVGLELDNFVGESLMLSLEVNDGIGDGDSEPKNELGSEVLPIAVGTLVGS